MNKNKNINFIEDDVNYCYKQWQEFTTLTEEERSVIDNITRLLTLKGKKLETNFSHKIVCINTGQTFKNAAAAARYFNVSQQAISLGLKRNKGRHLLRDGYLIERI